jgi:hypothetical protein
VQDVVKLMIQLTNSKHKAERYILVAENRSNKDILCWIADGYNKNRPKIHINKSTLLFIGFMTEIVGKIFRFTPSLNRSMALSASTRSYYSNAKIIEQFNYKFNSIENCIEEICVFDKRLKNQ